MHTRIKKQASRRLKIIEGQVRGLHKLVEKEVYCLDIITQSRAIAEALAGVERLILENHLNEHVVMQMKHGRERQAVAEMMKIYSASRQSK